MNMTTKTLFAAAITGLAMTSAQAAPIVIADPSTQVTASSEIPGYDRIDDHIVNGSGLTGGQHTNLVSGTMWLSAGNGFGGIDSDPSVTFDLGAVYTINSIHVWNYNENALTNRGVNGVSVEYGTTAALGSTVAGITSFAQADSSATYAGENFGGLSFNARYIKFDINSNHGDANTFYGLSEVQFDGVPVPEPSSLALLGLGGLCVLGRRRG